MLKFGIWRLPTSAACAELWNFGASSLWRLHTRNNERRLGTYSQRSGVKWTKDEFKNDQGRSRPLPLLPSGVASRRIRDQRPGDRKPAVNSETLHPKPSTLNPKPKPPKPGILYGGSGAFSVACVVLPGGLWPRPHKILPWRCLAEGSFCR